KGRVRPRPGRLITFGFSQGALAGFQVAARHPEEFAGAIVASPAGQYIRLEPAPPSPIWAQRGFILVCGAEEPDGIRMETDQVDAWLRHAGAKVERKDYPGVSEHALPRDFEERFPE